MLFVLLHLLLPQMQMRLMCQVLQFVTLLILNLQLLLDLLLLNQALKMLIYYPLLEIVYV